MAFQRFKLGSGVETTGRCKSLETNLCCKIHPWAECRDCRTTLCDKHWSDFTGEFDTAARNEHWWGNGKSHPNPGWIRIRSTDKEDTIEDVDD